MMKILKLQKMKLIQPVIFSLVLMILSYPAFAACTFYVPKCSEAPHTSCQDKINDRVARALTGSDGFEQVDSKEQAEYILSSTISCDEEDTTPLQGWFAELILGRGSCDGWVELESNSNKGERLSGEASGKKNRQQVIRASLQSISCPTK